MEVKRFPEVPVEVNPVPPWDTERAVVIPVIEPEPLIVTLIIEPPNSRLFQR